MSSTTAHDHTLPSLLLDSSPSTLAPVVEAAGGSIDDDIDSSSHCSSKDIDTTKQRAAKLERQQLARKETKQVFWLRIVCFTILMLTAILVSIGIYLYAMKDEEDDFQYVYDSSAERVIQSFHDSVANLLAGVDSFSVAITSYALHTESTFPNVTMPDMELRGASTRVITKSVASTWFPLVTDEERLGWEAYSREAHRHQMQSFQKENSYIIRQDQKFGLETNIKIPPTGGQKATQTDTPTGAPVEDTAIEDRRTCYLCPNNNSVTNADNEVEMPGQPGMTCQQLYDSGLQGLLPVDLCTMAQSAFPMLCGCGEEEASSTSEETKEPTSTGQEPKPGFLLQGKPFSPVLTTLQGAIQPNSTGPYLPFWQTSPALPVPALASTNILTFPPLAPAVTKVLETNQAYLSNAVSPAAMFEMFLARGQYRHQQEAFLGDAVTPFAYPVFDTFNMTNRKLVGITLSNIYWRLHFEQVLPPNARGIIAVLKNSANQSYTYQLDGPDVTFLGNDDLHDEKFDSMLWSAAITQYMEDYASPETEGYVATPLTKEGVQYTLHIYPSQDMKDDFVTNKPAMYAAVVAMIFAFTASFFFIYNLLVERRQRVVMDRAVKSTAVVSSLFPETVKERLINDTDEVPANPKKNKSNKPTNWKVTERDHNFSNERLTINDSDMAPQPKGKPIADKFENTTIMFADIAGFTSWSSERDPEQVFQLLETLYGAFDKLALARDVFKVETIGDCYLAITGCPSPQDDHAIRMAKFARDCMFKVQELTDVLAGSLGDDTRNLSFRVGLHSGSVTAGVLRGDRTRFQLFGDAVNTAARMESHGVKGRIHVSQATFEAICEHEGRGRAIGWVVPRREKIKAKGKGELQTYFMTGSFMRRGKQTASVDSTVSSRSLTSQEVEGTTERGEVTETEFTERSGTELTENDDDEIPVAVRTACKSK